MKNTIKKVLLICLFFVSLLNAGEQNIGFVKLGSELVTVITHPIEWFNPIRKAPFEEQHIIAQKHKENSNLPSIDINNISIIPASSHVATDIWGGLGVWGQKQVWLNNISKDKWGLTNNSEDNLAQAYKLSRWQLEPVFLLYTFNKAEWSTTLFRWDGMSHLVYMIDWIINTPSKYFRKTAYLIDKGHYKLLIDHLIQIPVLFVEGILSTIYHAVGIVIGTIFHPIDTIASVIGGIWFIIKGIFGGIIDFFLTLFLLFKSIF